LANVIVEFMQGKIEIDRTQVHSEDDAN
jgi:hypothetical protein